MKCNMKIRNCLKVIESLKGLLKIIGTGSLGMVGLYFFFKEEFSVTIAISLLMSVGLLLVLTIFEIFKRYAIIQKINLGGNNDN